MTLTALPRCFKYSRTTSKKSLFSETYFKAAFSVVILAESFRIASFENKIGLFRQNWSVLRLLVYKQGQEMFCFSKVPYWFFKGRTESDGR